MQSSSFQWDARKDQANREKHGVGFLDAAGAFLDERRILAEDLTHSTAKEKRYYCFGSYGGGILTVRFTYRDGVIRIFGAGYWRKGKRIYEQANQIHQRVVANLVQAEAWIMDGNYGGTTDARLAASDTVVLLDMPPGLCLWRILKRWVRFRGQSRPTMARNCPERWSWPFVWWVLTYRRRHLPKLLIKLSEASALGKNAVVLRSSREVEVFCRQVHHVAQQPHAAIGSR